MIKYFFQSKFSQKKEINANNSFSKNNMDKLTSLFRFPTDL